MNDALQRAFAEVARLPEDEQTELAEWLLRELTDEREWKKSFATSQDFLSAMADQALADAVIGDVTDLDFEKH